MTVTKYRYALFYNVIIVDAGIADLPTAARRRADEERPYHALTSVTFFVRRVETVQISATGGSDDVSVLFVRDRRSDRT